MRNLERAMQLATLTLDNFSNWFEDEGGVSHFVMSKVKMDEGTSQCEAVPDNETDFDFYSIYAYTKEGTCYAITDTATNTASEFRLMRDVRDSLNAMLPPNEPRKAVKS
ncbi:hypothetical protein HOS70_gp04 [Erwinia phage vB_EamP-S2]|uniref:Uncharacterized protein n=1 Tax=Erwinia phage vB_EamP-S2 TaxID=2070198 RepID=A0A2K9V518_9CAUD|nr:hypothetical protein HOS70_gp04 [Erwinia phage vB_EamP-S2]AUV57203.1 hypothetical protein [Erwinia phage vB_EamP-S2]